MTRVRLKKAVEPVRQACCEAYQRLRLLNALIFPAFRKLKVDVCHAACASARDCGQGDKHTF